MAASPFPRTHTPPLQLDRNSLSGTLDSLIGLDALTQVIVSHNQLTGTFPMDTIGAGNQNALLQVLECASNKFSGDLPDQVRQPSSLFVIFVVVIFVFLFWCISRMF